MARTRRLLPADVAVVFGALTTPETYPLWLVGCQDIRSVDDGWPAPGTAFHHRVGLTAGVTVADATEVLEVEAPHRLVLHVRARPFGRGRVTFRLTPTADGTEVEVDEVPVGPMGLLTPVLDPFTDRRNARSLLRLERYLVARQAQGVGTGRG